MQPNHYDLGHVPYSPVDTTNSSRMTRDPHHGLRNHAAQSHPRGGRWPMRSEDSWIEVASQPSSSSLSSAATNDDIVTTGLNVAQEQRGSHPQRGRRRRLQRLATVTTAEMTYSPQEPSIASSSQDEYEESESESDRVLSSSNEEINRQTLADPFLVRVGVNPRPSEAVPPSSDDDDNSTALGMRISSSPFVPQPNVFSHPPATRHPSWTQPTESHRSQPSMLSNTSRRTAIRRNSHATTTRSPRRPHQHSPYNMISPSHHADHDAALRASLSTLLSCAAAARGLPKSDAPPSASQRSRAPQPTSAFRLVSESVVMGEDSGGEDEDAPRRTVDPSVGMPCTAALSQPPMSRRSRNSSSSGVRAKRGSSPSKDRAGAPASKKSRRVGVTGPGTTTSPTLMTWVISAGVVVLFSAISFSAGYMLGREVGRTEVMAGIGPGFGETPPGALSNARASAGCGREAVKGSLKRLRWGTAAAGSSIIA